MTALTRNYQSDPNVSDLARLHNRGQGTNLTDLPSELLLKIAKLSGASLNELRLVSKIFDNAIRPRVEAVSIYTNGWYKGKRDYKYLKTDLFDNIKKIRISIYWCHKFSLECLIPPRYTALESLSLTTDGLVDNEFFSKLIEIPKLKSLKIGFSAAPIVSPSIQHWKTLWQVFKKLESLSLKEVNLINIRNIRACNLQNLAYLDIDNCEDFYFEGMILLVQKAIKLKSLTLFFESNYDFSFKQPFNYLIRQISSDQLSNLVLGSEYYRTPWSCSPLIKYSNTIAIIHSKLCFLTKLSFIDIKGMIIEHFASKMINLRSLELKECFFAHDNSADFFIDAPQLNELIFNVVYGAKNSLILSTKNISKIQFNSCDFDTSFFFQSMPLQQLVHFNSVNLDDNSHFTDEILGDFFKRATQLQTLILEGHKNIMGNWGNLCGCLTKLEILVLRNFDNITDQALSNLLQGSRDIKKICIDHSSLTEEILISICSTFKNLEYITVNSKKIRIPNPLIELVAIKQWNGLGKDCNKLLYLTKQFFQEILLLPPPQRRAKLREKITLPPLLSGEFKISSANDSEIRHYFSDLDTLTCDDYLTSTVDDIDYN